MKISLRWLSAYVEPLPGPEELAEVLERAGFSVEARQRVGGEFPDVVVARIVESRPHPNADRLSVCQVDDGTGAIRQIVCGAKNYQTGDVVPLALPGAELPGGLKIQTGRLRGVESQGMMCSARELGLGADEAGLLILPRHWKPGTPLREVFPPDVVFELEVTPNRPDCLGHWGVAREVAAFTGAALRILEPPPLVFEDVGEAVVEDVEGCPLYTLTRVSGLRNTASPPWMAAHLAAVGLRPINLAVDITNWVMMETGQPLHVFDAAKVRGRVRVRAAEAGERLLALDGREYELAGGELLIADEDGPLALAGVIGGEASGVRDATTEVLLESACFAPGRIRRAARAMGIATDSSHRFERGVDPRGTLLAARRAAALLAELGGARVAEKASLCGTWPASPPSVPLHFDRCRALLGADLSDSEIRDALSSLGLRETPGGWAPPSWRLDLAREVDLIEEVARRVGIEKIPSRVQAEPAPRSEADRWHDLLVGFKDRLAGWGLAEARSPVLLSPAQAEHFGPAVALRNPLGVEHSVLRPSLLPGLLEALGRNLRAGLETVAMFEAGKIFRPVEPEERQALALLLSGRAAARSWRAASPRALDFHDLKGLLAALLPGAEFRQVEPPPPFALAVEVWVRGEPAGLAGQLELARARALDAKGPVLLAELFPLLTWETGMPHYTPPPQFPPVLRDVALVVPRHVPYAEVESVLRGCREPLLAGFNVFDVFEDASGEKVPAGFKSLALALTFSAPDRTLKSEEAESALEKIKTALRESLRASFRE